MVFVPLLLSLCLEHALGAERSLLDTLAGQGRSLSEATCDLSLTGKDLGQACYDSCPGSSSTLSDDILTTCGNNAHAAYEKYRAKHSGAPTTGPGCPISGLFDVSGFCCLSCESGCSAGKPAMSETTTFYIICSPVFVLILAMCYWAFGSKMKAKLKTDLDNMKEKLAALPAETVAAAANIGENAVEETKRTLTTGARENATEAIRAETRAQAVDAAESAVGAAPAPSVSGFLGSLRTRLLGSAEETADAQREVVENAVDELEDLPNQAAKKLMGVGKTTAVWGAFNLTRFVVAEIATAAALLMPPPCLGGLQQSCEQGLLCCPPLLMYYVKLCLGIGNVMVNCADASQLSNAPRPSPSFSWIPPPLASHREACSNHA
jgi:hypothetical protein